MVFKFRDDLTTKENMPRFSEIAFLRITALGSFHYKKFFWSIRAEKCSFRTLAYFTQKHKTKVQRTRLGKIRFYISSIHDLNANFIKLFNYCQVGFIYVYLFLVDKSGDILPNEAKLGEILKVADMNIYFYATKTGRMVTKIKGNLQETIFTKTHKFIPDFL